MESHLDLSAQDLEFGFNETRRDRILRTYVRNNFHYHLNEIFAVLKVNLGPMIAPKRYIIKFLNPFRILERIHRLGESHTQSVKFTRRNSAIFK